MDAHARSRALEQHPRPSGGTGRRAGLLLVEYLAIAGGYVLLGLLGLLLLPDGRLVAIWPAGGFALAMLLLRGKAYLRMEYTPSDMPTLQHAAAIFTTACESALSSLRAKPSA